MRWALIALCCTGCSLLNSTSELRVDAGSQPDVIGFDAGPDPDGGPADGGVDGGPGPDVPDAGPADAGPDVDAGPPCFNIDRLEVQRPSHPPVFAFVFDGMATCNSAFSVTGQGFNADVQVSMGDDRATFVYTGPRVPIIDDASRMREFRVGAAVYMLRMPVERLQAVGMTVVEDIPFSLTPSLDIADDGTVVFDSIGLGSNSTGASGGNIFAWPTDGTITDPATVERPGQGEAPLHAPSISDDGNVIAFVRMGSQSSVELHHRMRMADGVSLSVPLGGNQVADSASVDVRHNGDDLYTVLVQVVTSSSVRGYGMWEYDAGRGTVDRRTQIAVENAEGGMLFRDGDEFGYAAIDGDDVFAVGSNGTPLPQSRCDASVDLTRVHLRRGMDDAYAHVGRCPAARVLAADDQQFVAPSDVDAAGWGMIGAATDHSIVLVRNGPMDMTARAYLLVDFSGSTIQDYTLNLNGQGAAVQSRIGNYLSGAALSPDGEWAVYGLIDASLPIARRIMRIYRVRTRTPL